MAVHDYYSPLGQELMAADLRTLRFFSRYINRKRRESYGFEELQQNGLSSTREGLELLEIGTRDEVMHSLSTYFSGCAQEERSQQTARNYLISIRGRYLIPLDVIEWLEENERACEFFFLSIASRYYSLNPCHKRSDAHREIKHQVPQNHKSRYEQFLVMLDDSGEANKADYVLQLVSDYENAQKRVKVLSWLEPNNDGACQWAWDYILNFHESRADLLKQAGGKETDIGYAIATIPQLCWLSPYGELEQKMAFYAALQTWKCSPAELTLFRTNISKAWRQRQLRRSDKVKAVNTHIRVESKEQLDALSRRAGLSLQKMLESLIEQAYLDMERKMP